MVNNHAYNFIVYHSQSLCSPLGVNSSLLESESVHLPLIYDSPPKSKPSPMTG